MLVAGAGQKAKTSLSTLSDDLLLVRPQGFGPALFHTDPLTAWQFRHAVGDALRERIAGHPSVQLTQPSRLSPS
jgi:hypothetical protein